MTDQKWLAESRSSQWMLGYLREVGVPRTKVGRRRLRLFACGGCHFFWDFLPEDALREAVLAAERFADGELHKDRLAAIHSAAQLMDTSTYYDMRLPRTRSLEVAVSLAVTTTSPSPLDSAFMMTAMDLPLAGRVPNANALLCDLMRDIFGNPFRPIAFDPAWRTSTAVGLAETMYAARDFAPMPILADALQDAGCEDANILAHCRDEATVHVRGCWVVDLVLGKS